jgi:uncharacterized paraquat-inducible protein A
MPTLFKCPRCDNLVDPKETAFCPKCGLSMRGLIPAEYKPASFFIVAAGLLLIVGAVLPWGSVLFFGRINIYGYEGDGKITGGIGVVLLIAGLLGLA